VSSQGPEHYATIVRVDAFLGSLAGVVVGSGVTYLTQWGADRRREEREARKDLARLYNDGIAAVAAVRATRWEPDLRIDPKTFPAISDEKMRQTIERLETESLGRYLANQLAARVALSALLGYASELEPLLNKREIAAGGDFDELMSLLSRRRSELL
jgi:hypothetical protein